VPPSQRTEQEIPPALEAVVLRCLEKDPRARPASVAQLSQELAALGLEPLWTAERAREWWRVHEPIAESEEDLPSLQIESSSSATLSQIRRLT
jgi:serine/threonine-protein kinase